MVAWLWVSDVVEPQLPETPPSLLPKPLVFALASLQVVLAVAVFIWFRHEMRASRYSDRALAKHAAQLTAGCPKQVDEAMQLIEVKAGSKLLFYTYRLSFRVPNVSAVVRELEQHQETVRLAVCKDAVTRDMLEYGVTFRYTYTDVNGMMVNSFGVKAADCGP